MLPANLEREIQAATAIRDLQSRVRRLETLEAQGAGCLFLIDSQTGSTFTTIAVPAAYKHLYMVYSAAAITPPVGDSIGLRFNADTGPNYDWIRRLWTSATEATFTDGASTFANIGLEGPFSTTHAAGFALIPDYLSTTKHKSWAAEGFSKLLSPATYHLFKLGGRWLNLSAITSIDIPGTYISNSTFSLYGLC